MNTWSAGINPRLDLFLGDSIERDTDSLTYSVPLRVAAWNWAQDVLCYYAPYPKSMTLSVGDDGRTGILPSDFFDVDMLYDADEERWWRLMTRKPGDFRPTDDDVLEFWVFGRQMFLEKDVGSDEDDLTLYYWAYYPPIEYELQSDGETYHYPQDTVYVPRWAELAVMHLTAYSCLTPGSVESADLSQFKIEFESGTPIHNPRLMAADWHIKQFHHLVHLFPRARMGRSG